VATRAQRQLDKLFTDAQFAIAAVQTVVEALSEGPRSQSDVTGAIRKRFDNRDIPQGLDIATIAADLFQRLEAIEVIARPSGHRLALIAPSAAYLMRHPAYLKTVKDGSELFLTLSILAQRTAHGDRPAAGGGIASSGTTKNLFPTKKPQQPPSTVEDDRYHVPIFYTTDRELVGESPPQYAKDSKCSKRRFGWCNVVFPKNYRITPPAGDLVYALMHSVGLTRTQTPRIKKDEHYILQPARFRQKLKLAMKSANSTNVLVFVHGAIVDFEGAIAQAAVIALNANFPGPTVAYCWPTRGTGRAYGSDLDLAPIEAEHFALWLSSLASQFADATIHVVAHSLGSLVAMLGIKNAPLTGLIGEFALASPDLDLRVYAEIAPAVCAKVKRRTVYTSAKDKALQISALPRNWTARVGASAEAAAGHGFDVVDATDHGGDGSFFQHDVAFRGPLSIDLANMLRGLDQVRPSLRPVHGGRWYVVRR